MKTRPSAIIVKGNKILTLKYSYGGQLLFALPGGNVEENEIIKETLIRELQEELGIQTNVLNIVAVAETYNETKKSSVLHLCFITEITAGEPIPNPEQTTTLGVEWLEIEKLEEYNLYPNIIESIKKLPNTEINNIYLGAIQQKWL